MRINNERGTVLVLVALLTSFLAGVAALAIDLGHLYMVRNELQNAADAGALAGAAQLYIMDPATNAAAINPDANQIAFDAATANRATAKNAGNDGGHYQPVDIHFGPDNPNPESGDIRRGHWGFSLTPRFFWNDSLVALSQDDIWNSTPEQLDQNTDLINAVEVTVRREANPVSSFFANVFGLRDFLLSATAVAYLGCMDTINPGEIDLPLAVCRETVMSGGQLQCNFSRLINSSDKSDANTGGWTNFSQDTEWWDPEGCHNPNTSEVAGTGGTGGLICNGGNPKPVVIPKTMGVNGGAVEPASNALRDCWEDHLASSLVEFGKPMPKEVTLPVVECGNSEGKIGNANGPCLPTFPPVRLKIIWVSPKTWPEPQKWDYAPDWMGDFDENGNPHDFDQRGNPDGYDRWRKFVEHFQLRNPAGQLAYDDYYPKTIYAMPNCEEVLPMGSSSGIGAGNCLLSANPVLVR
jgi:hypothetical protein